MNTQIITQEGAALATAVFVPKPEEPAAAFKNQVLKNGHEFSAALPAHIPVERYTRVVMTAVVNNPELLLADRRSLLEAAMRAAQDGLLPDGREGAFVIFNAKIKGTNQWIKKVQWMPMIAGILKKVRNSGELVSISAYVAYSNDEFSYELGDEEKISHRPALDNRGIPRLVYAIAKLKDGGVYREIMTIADIEKVRAISRAANDGPWVVWWDEMARKSVLRRLAKRLPMSSDLDDFLRRGDEPYRLERVQHEDAPEPPRISSLHAELDAIAAAGIEPPLDPATGKAIEAGVAADDQTGVMGPSKTIDDKQLAAGRRDPALQALTAEAHEKANGGGAILKHWIGRLNAIDHALIAPYLDSLHEQAKYADAERDRQ